MPSIKIVAMFDEEGVPEVGYQKDPMTKPQLAVLIMHIEKSLEKLKEDYHSGGLEVGRKN